MTEGTFSSRLLFSHFSTFSKLYERGFCQILADDTNAEGERTNTDMLTAR